jgi:hypothetical protein
MAELHREGSPARDRRLRALFLFLIVAAALSFGLCVFSDVRMSSTHVPLPDELAVAVAWLAGHSLHGAIVVLLPYAYFFLSRASTSALPDGDTGLE